MARTLFRLVIDFMYFVGLGLRSHARLAAENLFLRKQLALYLERQVKPRRLWFSKIRFRQSVRLQKLLQKSLRSSVAMPRAREP